MSIDVNVLPRPAFYSDLEANAKEGRIKAVLLLLDAGPDTSARTLAEWVDIMPGIVLHAACMAGNEEVVAASLSSLNVGSRSRVHLRTLSQWCGNAISQDDMGILLTLEPVPEVIISCQAYDAYGEYIKTALEESLLPLLRKWKALYLVHDPQFKVLRPQDYHLLKDRLIARPKRLRVYSGLVRTILAASYLLSRITEMPQWRRIE